MAPVKAHTPAMAERLIDDAAQLLAEEGAAALTLRRLASTSGTSTMAVYTLFGDKPGLLARMFEEGFRRLGAALRTAAEGCEDPLSALAAIGMAYRATALANPHLYDLMFGRPVPGFTPDATAEHSANAAYAPLLEAVERCLASGDLQGSDPARIARFLWAVSHGMVSLELTGKLPGDNAERDAAYVDALIWSASPFLNPD